MLKWVLRFFYLMIISVATVYVYGSANYSRLEAYYNDFMKDELNNPDAYLMGINTIMGLEYHTSEPVYTFQSNEGDYQFKLGIYPIAVTLNDELIDGLMVYVYDVSITENGEAIPFPKIRITVKLDEATYKSGETFLDTATIIFDSEKTFPYSYVPNVFLLYSENYLKVDGEERYANITDVRIAYSDGEENEAGGLVFKETLLFIGGSTLSTDAAHLKSDDLIINPLDYRLSLQFENGLDDTAIETFGLVTDSGNLSDYNNLIWRTMLIYGGIVVLLTYVLFFHKYVMIKVRDKKQLTDGSKNQVKSNEAIFKDIDYTDKDGK